MWVVIMSCIKFTMNSASSDSIVDTPFYLVLGILLAAPVDHLDGLHYIGSDQRLVYYLLRAIYIARNNL